MPVLPRLAGPLATLRQRAGGLAARGFLEGLARAGALHPHADPARHGVEVLRDVPYRPGSTEPRHRLDIWRPILPRGPSPAVLYIHGGAFRILSKETHWLMALAFARRGCTVFNIGYRLAPQHPFPAAIDDVCHAHAWVAQHAARHGGDLARYVVAGESAGANLATALAVATCFRRAEPFAQLAFDTGVRPRALVPMCGMLQVTDSARFERRRPQLSRFMKDRMREVTQHYLPGDTVDPELELADPLRVLESDRVPDHAWPPTFAGVGTKDPLLDDTRRLRRALERRGVPVDVRYYPGEMHAFHALVFRRNAVRAWADLFAFLRLQVDAELRPIGA
ncbi:MAG: hypothetical protein EXR79_02755 [Myxococcales bacterium]|nr:hypothetical protein [Myxococcales bacterium]